MSAARDEILMRVRSALGEGRPAASTLPAYRRAGTLDARARVDLFAARVADYRASLGVAIAIGSSLSLAFFLEPIWSRASMSSAQMSARWCVGSVLSR